VALGFGDPVSEIADLNFQTGPDPHLESRLLLYNAALHHRFQVSVRSILIRLRPSADHPSLTGEQVYSGGGGRVEFRYEIVRLWHESPEAFLRGGVGLMPLATLCQPPQGMTVEEMLPGIIDEIGRRLTAEVARPEAVWLMTAAFILAGLRLPRTTLASIFAGVDMVHESSAFEIMEDRGRVRGARRLLARQAQERFGIATAEAEIAIREVSDLERLERMAVAILRSADWNEVVATP